MANINVNITELLQMLELTPADHNVMLAGKHGIGKSEILTEFFCEGHTRRDAVPGAESDPGDLIGVGWPCVNDGGLISPEAIIILDHLSGQIWVGDHLARLGDILTAENKSANQVTRLKNDLLCSTNQYMHTLSSTSMRV